METPLNLLKRLTPEFQAKYEQLEIRDKELMSSCLTKYNWIGDVPISTALTICGLFGISSTDVYKFYFLFGEPK
jgi:hypothetical protein